MYFDAVDLMDEAIGNADILRVIRLQQRMHFLTGDDDDELMEMAEAAQFNTVPTHTEDGIPIRKIYVSNLPPNTTRTQLFEVFAQYGFIKSCWLRMCEKGTPTYAFVTFSNPADAHKALLAPNYEKRLRGRNLRTSPADSWHQPSENAEGKVVWRQKNQARIEPDISSSSNAETHSAGGECSSSAAAENTASENETQAPANEKAQAENQYDIMDVLNRDCIHHILQYVPIKDLIRSERVNRRWSGMIQEYFSSMRSFRTSWWKHGSLTTAVLRNILKRVGAGLLRLHIDHHGSTLNDRTAHVVGKFCPNLEELMVVDMHTKNWNPLVYGCKNLKALTFISCSRLTDSHLAQIIKKDSKIVRLFVSNNSRLTGIFLTGPNPPNLCSLGFINCCSIQGTVLAAAVSSLPRLTSLRLDVGSNSLWKVIPSILKQLPLLEELSLIGYMASDNSYVSSASAQQPLLEAFSKLTELKILTISRNIYITNEVLKTVAETCHKLRVLDVSCCNFKRGTANEGVGDEGVKSICESCSELTNLNVSYLAALTDSGASALAKCARLQTLAARGMPNITAKLFVKCIDKCLELEELDLSGCDSVNSSLVVSASKSLSQRARPKPLKLLLAGTAAALDEGMLVDEYPCHPQLKLDWYDDRCNPNLRPDFVDSVLGDDDFEDILDLDDHFDPYYPEFVDSDDDDIFDGDDFEFGVEWGFDPHDHMFL